MKAIFFLIFSITCRSSVAQDYDSLSVYAISMNSSYHVKIDKNLIKDQVDRPFVFTTSEPIKHILSVIDTIKGIRISTLSSNNIDVRLVLEFFHESKLVTIIGVTSYDTMFINKSFYRYNRDDLKKLESFIPGLLKTLGI